MTNPVAELGRSLEALHVELRKLYRDSEHLVADAYSNAAEVAKNEADTISGAKTGRPMHYRSWGEDTVSVFRRHCTGYRERSARMRGSDPLRLAYLDIAERMERVCDSFDQTDTVAP